MYVRGEISGKRDVCGGPRCSTRQNLERIEETIRPGGEEASLPGLVSPHRRPLSWYKEKEEEEEEGS